MGATFYFDRNMSVCVSELMERSVKWVHVLCRLDRFFLLLFDTLVYALESFDTKREREGERDKNQTKILRSITQKCVSEKLIGVKWEKHKSLPPFSSYIGLMGMRNGGSLAIKWIITLMHNVRYSFVLLSLLLVSISTAEIKFHECGYIQFRNVLII